MIAAGFPLLPLRFFSSPLYIPFFLCTPSNPLSLHSYTIAAGFAADVDQFDDFTVRNKSRVTSVADEETGAAMANIEGALQGFFISGSLPVGDAQGVHSLVDVQVFSYGPGHELFNSSFAVFFMSTLVLMPFPSQVCKTPSTSVSRSLPNSTASLLSTLSPNFQASLLLTPSSSRSLLHDLFLPRSSPPRRCSCVYCRCVEGRISKEGERG
jgi:hypothetical protein